MSNVRALAESTAAMPTAMVVAPSARAENTPMVAIRRLHRPESCSGPRPAAS